MGSLRGRVAAAGMVLLVMAPWRARGDEFERLGGELLAPLLRAPAARAPGSLSFRELEALPAALRDTRSALVLVKTDMGNLARLLVSPGFRKPLGGQAPLIPVLLVERFAVFDGGHPASRLARGKDLLLFPGFRLDLDTGQVVPDGLGGDILFTARGDQDGTMHPIGPARLVTLEHPPTLPKAATGLPSEGRVVRIADVAGSYRLMANGQWSGVLALAVDADGKVSGTFSSDATGTAYPASGKVDVGSPQNLQFTIDFPRTKQEYQGVLWSEGKSVIAGTLTMAGRVFSFVAVREGATLDPETQAGTAALLAPPTPGGTWLTVRIEADPDRYLLGKEPKSRSELAEALAGALRADPRIRVLLTAPETLPFPRVRQALEVIEAAGITSIRLAPSALEP